MPETPSSKLPALFVRLPVATHDLLRDLAATADESVSRYIVTLIEQQRPGGAQLPPRHPRGRERVEAVAASDEPVKRKRGRPRKVPLAPQPPVEVAVEAAPVVPVEKPPRRPRGRPRKVPAEVVAVPPHKRQPRVEAVPVEEPAITAADIGQLVVNAVRLASPSIPDTLDRIRAALARLEEPPVEELPDVAGESRVVVEDAP